MRIKSYFAKSITEAMAQARAELGPDAMIMASNRTTGDAQRLGAYEVVFGLADAASPSVTQPAPNPEVAKPQPPEGLERLRERMEGMRKSVSKKREQAAAATTGSRIAAAFEHSGFPSSLAAELGKQIMARSRETKQDILSAARAELAARLRVAPKLDSPGRKRSVIALVGPPGVGKTTMIAKLAVAYGLNASRPVRLISTDSYRLGGSDLMKKYADAMGVRFEAPHSIDLLDRSLSSEDRNTLVLVDTQGFGPANLSRSAPLASYLSKRADVDVHLVLPAYVSHSDLSMLAAPFQSFLPSKLMFAGVDLCAKTGSMLAHAITTEFPVSFLGTGQEVPEDLEEASVESLTARLASSLVDAATVAA